MKQTTLTSITLLAVMAIDSHAFVPAATRQRAFALSSSPSPVLEREFTRQGSEVPYFADLGSDMASGKQSVQSDKKVAAKKPAKGGAKHKEGVLSPVVLLSKNVLGDEKLNKLRAKVISLHSDVIGNFVSTSDTVVGDRVLKQLFELSDVNGNGRIEESELKKALQTLGFEWLQDKQVKGIFGRADKDGDGTIDYNEWQIEAPKTLRTNLIKLAKKNGGDMGLLV